MSKRTLQQGDKVTNEAGAMQSFVSADYECIPPVVLRLLAQCLGRGKRIYGYENWKGIPIEDNLSHAMNHLVEWRAGDRAEPHLVNAIARLTFALSQAIDMGEQLENYVHPDDKPDQPDQENYIYESPARPIDESKPLLSKEKFAVGQIWKNRKGEKVAISKVFNGVITYETLWGREWKVFTNGMFYHSQKGENYIHDLDLISPIE